MTPTVKAIETRYAGCRFRSRLEARWAVFFDTLNIPWQYEPQGFTLSDGRNYLPDFLLPECGTWIEVKGSPDAVDWDLLQLAANDIAKHPHWDGCEQGPELMLLGPIPRPRSTGDYGWPSWSIYDGFTMELDHGFGYWYKNRRPWSYGYGTDGSQECFFGLYHADESDYAQPGYEAARSARFEHGEVGR